MDLEIYKEAWKNQPKEANLLSSVDIYKMAQASSSSIVKWIFIIGILEFVVVNSLYLFVNFDKQLKMYDDLGITNIIFYSQIVAYAILLYFLYQFYMNYKRITVLDSTKYLLTKIVKTRKTVRNYVLFNLAYILFVTITLSIAILNSSENNFTGIQTAKFIGLMFVFTIILLAIIFLVYQLLYGILLRKLKKNYKEISKLDNLN